MKTAVIYARQKASATENTIFDQVTTCRKYATTYGIKVVNQYKDIVYPNNIQTSGLLSLLKDAKTSTWDLIIIDQLKELGRKQNETNKILKQLKSLNKQLIIVDLQKGDCCL